MIIIGIIISRSGPRVNLVWKKNGKGSTLKETTTPPSPVGPDLFEYALTGPYRWRRPPVGMNQLIWKGRSGIQLSKELIPNSDGGSRWNGWLRFNWQICRKNLLTPGTKRRWVGWFNPIRSGVRGRGVQVQIDRSVKRISSEFDSTNKKWMG